MENNKKLTIKRLVIFYVLALIPLIIIAVSLRAAYGRGVWLSEDVLARQAITITGFFGMFAPTLANFLTRLITKEGMKKSYLGYTAKKGNIRYFALSIIFPLAQNLLGMFLLCAIYLRDMSFSEMINTEGLSENVPFLFMQLAYAVIIFFPAFGEEFGWRGYMMPKLMELMPKPAAVVVGGILWGVWHSPLTVEGHDFGLDYPGFPWLGILMMCVLCTSMNATLTFLTEKTKSIYPAAVCHMVNNDMQPSILAVFLLSEKAMTKISDGIGSTFNLSVLLVCATAVVGVPCFILLCRGDKKKAAEVETKEAA